MSMKSKIAGGLLLGPIMFYIMTGGRLLLLATVVFFVAVASYELFALSRNKGYQPIMWFGVPLAMLFPIVSWLHVQESQQFVVSFAVIFVLMVQFTLAAQGRPAYRIVDLALTIFGAVYIGGLMSYLISLRALYDGYFAGASEFNLIVVLPCAGAWAADTAALFSGKAVGRTPLAPKVSPNKTVEGFVGGLIGAMFTVITMGTLGGIPFEHTVVLGVLCGVLGPLGDLCESAFKREMAVKDTGTMIPGAGGVMDRMDSILFTIPVTYYYLKLFVVPMLRP